MNKKEFLEYYISVRDKNEEIVIETDSTSKLKKVYNWLAKLSTVNSNYSFYIVSHIKGMREKIYDTEKIKLYFNRDGSISVYNGSEDILLCHIS